MLENKGKISVIVPVYMAEEYLKKCVDSIRSQTYSNLEIILVDDGSPDNSGVMCDEFAREDERIKVIHKKNGGQSDARNVGIENATGEYIGFVDSDDYIEKDMYEVLIKGIIENNADVASISIAMTRKNGQNINGTNTKQKSVYEGEEIIKQLLLHNTLKNYSCDKLYRREILKDIRYVVGLCYEDVPMMFNIMSRAKKVVYIDEIKYYYVKHGKSLSAFCSEKNVNDYLKVITDRFNIIEKKYQNLSRYNLYAIANTTVHAYYKVMLSDKSAGVYAEKLDFLKDKCKYIFDECEKEIVELFSVYQKACFYMLLNDEELFIKFLEERQRKNKSNSAS